MKKNLIKTFKRNFKREWQLYLLAIIPTIYLIIFDFAPMYGLQIAFRDYRIAGGITGSEWVGLRWFKQFLSDPQFGAVFKNTLILSLYGLATFPIPIIFALMITALRGSKYKKVIQNVSYMPHFISTTIFVGIIHMIFSPVNGLYGNFYHLFGGEGYPTDFRFTAEAFRHLYIWSGEWKNLGWSAIIYIAALSGVSAELHEAAQLDGASRLQRMWHIDIPSILPTVCIKLILSCSGIISVGAEKVLLMQNDLNLSVSEVISTHVYKVGLSSFRNFSYGTAVSLFNTAINLSLLFLVNGITKKMSEGEISYF